MLKTYDATLRLAERVLSSTFNSPVHLIAEARLDSRWLVLRCTLSTACETAPARVLLKQMSADALADHMPPPRECFLNELASLRFFHSLRDQVTFGPRLYGSHDQAHLLIVEDLGNHRTLLELLRGDDAGLATDVLIKFGQGLAEVHIATLAKEHAFKTFQAEARALLLPSVANQDLRDAMADVRACLDALGIKAPLGFERAMHALEAAIHDKGSPLRTWIHCDLRPLNILHLASTQIQVVDFELARFGHALLDAVVVRMAFPPPPAPVVSAGQAMPPPVIQRFEDTYRAELSKGIPEAADDAYFQQAYVQACAHWALVKLLSMWHIYLRERLLHGERYDHRAEIASHKAAYARFRQQGVAYLQTFVDVAAGFEQLTIIRATTQRLIAALLERWPEIKPLSTFPAFSGSLGCSGGAGKPNLAKISK